jgi:hypothetical protein
MYVVDKCTSSVEVISRLKNLLCPENKAAKSGLTKKLHSMRLEAGTPLQDHADQVLKIKSVPGVCRTRKKTFKDLKQ